MLKEVSDRIVIGDAATTEALRELAEQGYGTVIDLCTPSENNQLQPSQAQMAGMQLERLPVTVSALALETVVQFGRLVGAAEGPVYVRCASGRRATFLSLLYEADRHGRGYEEFDRQAQALGVDFSSTPALAQFARNYLHGARQPETASPRWEGI